jgi:hypothetical protein
MPLLPSPWHASYPRGHSLENHLIASALTQVAQSAKDVLDALAWRIGRNREVARVHFPGDTQAGRAIARLVSPYLEKFQTFRTALEEAIKEYRS